MTDAAAAAPPRMLEEIRAGLSRAQKELPPKYFYDERGSLLFDEITRLPEYYLTRAERALLERHAPALVAAYRPATLVELGAGSADKTRIILDAMLRAGPAAYVPVDVSEEFLAGTAAALREEYPQLEVRPAVADISESLALPRDLSPPVLHAFLGSTIGNFPPAEAAALLLRIAGAMNPGDRFLMGVDLRKEPARIEAAYNDGAGVTAEFNRNMLRVLNAATGADFDPGAYEHRAFYDGEHHRIEMHLVSRQAQEVNIPGVGILSFRAGETLRTEISCKHDRPSVEALFGAAGLRLERWLPDDAGDYAIALAAAA